MKKRIYFSFFIIFSIYFIFLIAKFYIINVVNIIFEFDKIFIKSIELLSFIFGGLILFHIFFNIIEIIISIIMFNNTNVSFINFCYNNKFYIDNSLENILIGKNGPKICINTSNDIIFKDIYNYKKIKFKILLLIILITSIAYFVLYINYILIILIVQLVYAISLLSIYIKYDKLDLYNEALTLCSYQNVINYNLINYLKKAGIFKFKNNRDIELYIKLKIIMLNNNIKFENDNIEIISEKNIFYLLYIEILNNISNIKNKETIEYKYIGYYLNNPISEKLFFIAKKLSYEGNINELICILPYRLQKIIL